MTLVLVNGKTFANLLCDINHQEAVVFYNPNTNRTEVVTENQILNYDQKWTLADLTWQDVEEMRLATEEEIQYYNQYMEILDEAIQLKEKIGKLNRELRDKSPRKIYSPITVQINFN